jgi:hypothetical protein
MKRLWIGAVAVVMIAGLWALPAVRDEARWRLAELRDTHRAYTTCTEKAWAKSSHTSEAWDRAGKRREGEAAHPRIPARLFWRWMVLDGSPEACVEHLEA